MTAASDHPMADADRRLRFPVGAAVTLEQLELNPYPVLATLRTHEPVSWVPALGAWVVTRRDLAVTAMRDAEQFTVDDPRFTTAAVLGPSMLSLDGPEHARHRAPFAPAFRPGILREQFDEFLAVEVGRLVDDMAVGNRVPELRTGLAGPLAVNTITRFLGLRDVGADEVLEWYYSISKAIVDLTRGMAVEAVGDEAVARIHTRVQQTLVADGADQAGSLVQRVAASGALGDDEFSSAVAVLMFGAIETSEGMTANALWHALTTPGLWAALREDRTLVPNMVEESLRLEPAAAVVDRYTTVDVELADVLIPAGELVTLSLLGANRDPDVFANPDVFDLERQNVGQHVAFVQGPHACIGLHLARMETVAALNGLLDRVPNVRIDNESSAGPQGLVFRKAVAVTVAW